MVKIRIAILGLLFLCAVFPLSASAQEPNRVYFTSQPDEILIFFNNIAFVKDQITLPVGTEVAVTLPPEIFPDTLVLREDEARVHDYRLRSADGQLTVIWESASNDGETREITLDYLINGVSWRPKYDMWISGQDDETVSLDFFAEITNPGLSLHEVDVTLAAGRVNTSNQVTMEASVTLNQYVAGYEAPVDLELSTGAVEIQTLYPIGQINAQPGETIYTSMQQASLPARRVLLWNAGVSNQVSVIYKVRNDSALPLAEGIVRTYEDGLFLGSDFVEQTPVNSEGSITVGVLQGMRVNRSETQTALNNNVERRRTQVELTIANFNAEPVTLEIVDAYPGNAAAFIFSQEAERQAGNLLRWEITLQPGEETKITYQYDQ